MCSAALSYPFPYAASLHLSPPTSPLLAPSLIFRKTISDATRGVLREHDVSPLRSRGVVRDAGVQERLVDERRGQEQARRRGLESLLSVSLFFS